MLMLTTDGQVRQKALTSTANQGVSYDATAGEYQLGGTSTTSVPFTTNRNVNLGNNDLSFTTNGGATNLVVMDGDATNNGVAINANGSGAIALTGTTNVTGATTVVGTTNINNSGTASTNVGNSTGALTLEGTTVDIDGTTDIAGTTTINSSSTNATTIGNTSGTLTLAGGTVGVTGATGVTTTATTGNVGVTASAGNVNVTATGAGNDVNITATDEVDVTSAVLDVNVTTATVDATTIGLTGTTTVTGATTVVGATNINATGTAATTIGNTATGGALAINANNDVTIDVGSTSNDLVLSNIATTAGGVNMLMLTTDGQVRQKALTSTANQGVSYDATAGEYQLGGTTNTSVPFTGSRFLNLGNNDLSFTTNGGGTNLLVLNGDATNSGVAMNANGSGSIDLTGATTIVGTTNINTTSTNSTAIGNTLGTVTVSGSTTFNNQAQFDAGLRVKVTTTGVTITLNETHYIVVGTNAGAISVNLPAAVSNAGRMYIIKSAGAGDVTIDGNASETIDGLATYTIAGGGNISKTIVCDGSNWYVIGN
jgi:hypothetical protein